MSVDEVLDVDPERAFCSCCGGRPVDIDDRIVGMSVRAIRRRHDLRAKDVALVMDVSPQYLSDLELGRRPWSLARVREYKQAVGNILDVVNESAFGETVP